VIAQAFTANSTDSFTAAVTVKCTGTANAANANDVAGQAFTIEQIQ
jgi:hypothetical protein